MKQPENTPTPDSPAEDLRVRNAISQLTSHERRVLDATILDDLIPPSEDERNEFVAAFKKFEGLLEQSGK